MRFTDELREASGDQWTRVTHHKFTDELAQGTIEFRVLYRYLVQDHRFLDAFVCLLASIVAKARCLEDRIEGCQFLALITGKENTYFERSFKKIGYPARNADMIPDSEATKNFVNLMRDVTKNGSLGEMLAVIVVCEWTYLSWGERVLPFTKRDDFMCYEWVDLHSGEYFASVVEYLRRLLDKEGELMADDEEEREKVKSRFLQAVQCEEDFFDDAYSLD